MKTKKMRFSHNASVFGLDVGHSSFKVMQIDSSSQTTQPKVVGYGTADYPADSVNNGVIVKPEAMAKSMYDLFSSGLVGVVDSKKVACSVPTSRTFSRQMTLPPMEDKDLAGAVQLEAEQYIPLHPNELYIDYEITSRTPQGVNLIMVAVPKNIIDSYIRLLESLELDPVVLEPTMNAVSRLFKTTDPPQNQASILIDFGAVATDMAVIDHSMSLVSTVQGGTNNITDQIAKQLKLSQNEAYKVKNEYGLNYSDERDKIRSAVEPMLSALVKEIEKIVRYYEERMGHTGNKIGQIITIGGGASMPGLSEYLTNELHLPSHQLDPWSKLDFGQLQPPNDSDRSMFITVAGEAIISPSELERD